MARSLGGSLASKSSKCPRAGKPAGLARWWVPWLVGCWATKLIGGGRGRTAATVVGAVAGGLAGNAVEGRMQQGYTQMYRISIQLDQGGVRAYDVSSPGDLRQGDRVRLVNGQISRY